MNSDVWQSLLHLESRDIVSDWFERIHGRKLNARRAKEIIASARQGREYFRSASTASFAVRPLLAFYGVASLCRSLTLLHRRDSGEEGLRQGHGLEAIAWSATLSSDLPVALASISKLRVRTCGGLFSDLVAATHKRTMLRVYDRTIPVPFDNEEQRLGRETSLSDILDRLPDISTDVSAERPRRWIRLKNFVYSPDSGATITVHGTPDHPVCIEYAGAGFELSPEEDPYDASAERTVLKIDETGVKKYFPQVLDTRVIRTMGGNPSPHLVSRFSPDAWFSQLSITYMVSFILGMLARYFPTHWGALMGGEKGDAIWPNINAAQTYVEAALPELVLEVIADSLFAPRLEVADGSLSNASGDA
ncbi:MULTISPECIES: YaaC family protein [Rhizobium]|uniref:YaaC-like Protein n=1 Tax=Rhizobium paranaense TaxID=1650438 RepID=A0A7W9D3Y6_9HYPH|nr:MULTISPECIES: YaaC family protein [Rhizobium]MBB5576396.1 hypothetical protein [Rhizobium paranaense]PST62564.1 hypothetical protein C9E91_13565 [Rhizobium sp. SEMIA4064]